MKKLLSAIAAATVLVSAPIAQAGPLITQWGFSVSSNWNTGTTVFNAGNGTQVNTNDVISWGGTGNYTLIGQNPQVARSAIAIEGGTLAAPSTGFVNTNGTALPAGGTPFGLGSLVAHYNNSLDSSRATLDKTTLTSSLTLTPNQPFALPSFPALSVGFTVDFFETPNNASSCWTGSITVCDDIFVLNVPNLTTSFVFDGNEYTVTQFTTSGSLGILPNAACAAAGVAAGCIGFTTEEGKRNEAQFAFAITGKPVEIPEPGSLALLGLGLLGVAAMRRRQTKA